MKVFTRVVELVDTSRFNIGICSNECGFGFVLCKKLIKMFTRVVELVDVPI
jgi:hypothetical protein